MSDCKHCWHVLGHVQDYTLLTKVERCCHCGETRTEDVYPEGVSGGQKWVEPEHGPHAPFQHPQWAGSYIKNYALPDNGSPTVTRIPGQALAPDDLRY